MENDDRYSWHLLADHITEINFSNDGLAEVEIEGKKICVALAANTLFACAAKCPHAGGMMSKGYLDMAGNIVCPVHRYKFNLQTGRNSSGEGYYLKTYPVKTGEHGVFIGFEKTGLFGWLK